jgi:hypothetical protein
MQTGQNSVAPENSLPQLGQVRRVSVFMDLTVLQMRLKLPANARGAERKSRADTN